MSKPSDERPPLQAQPLRVETVICDEDGSLSVRDVAPESSPVGFALRTVHGHAPSERVLSSSVRLWGRKFEHLKSGLYVSDDATNRDVADLFGLVADTWEEDEVDGAFNDAVYARLATEAGAFCPNVKTVLDFGCGTGLGLRMLTNAYPDAGLLGFDLSSKMCAVARARGVQTVGECCGRLDVASGSIDIVISAFVLHLIAEDAWFHEVARVLRPGGVAAWNLFSPPADWHQTLKPRLTGAGLHICFDDIVTFRGGEVELEMPLIVTHRES